MNDQSLRRTPLYAQHTALNARMVPFAGYEMPVQYTGLIDEHRAVRERVGLFDVSHMGEFIVEGPQSEALLQYALTNNVAKLEDGRALYTVMCREDGGVVDDLIVYRERPDRFFLCVNASRRSDDWEHLNQLAGKYDCALTDLSDEYAQIAVQGPKADALLQKLTTVKIADLKPFSWVDAEVGGVANVRIARTGYTGESGAELYTRTDADKLWATLMEQGEVFGIAACGLGARDTLRMEMKYPLYGNDLDLEHSPIEAGLGWVVKLKKGDFVGREVMARQKEEGPSRKLVGFKMVGRGIPRAGYPIKLGGEAIGTVTSGTHSPTLNEPIGIGYVQSNHSEVGTRIEIEIRGKVIEAKVVPTPFYQREDG